MTVTEVILPKLGLTMDEGKFVAWRKDEGDRVEAGDVLFEVETDKATMEVESAVSGYLRRRLAAPGEAVPVASVVALISSEADETLPARAAAPETAAADARPDAPADTTARRAASAPTAGDGRIVASPAARKRAQERGVDLATVTASRGGRISLEDVEAAAALRREPLSRMRRAIAERMTLSFRDVPQFSLSRDVDMTVADAARRRAGVSYTDLVVAACARALREHPRLAMRWDGDGLVPTEGIHIGIAVAVDDGLIVPVIRDADRKDLAALAAEREALQEGARAGRLPAHALSGAVFSISNLGQQGVDRFTAIVNPPEAAILAVGRVRDQVVAVDGAPAVRPIVSLTLTVDHRVADGAEAARFLADIAERLERGA